MKRHDCQPASAPQEPQGGFEPLAERFDLPVDLHPQTLKGTGRGVDLSTAPFVDSFDQLSQIGGSEKGPLLAFVEDRLDNGSGAGFLAEHTHGVHQLLAARLVDELFRRDSAVGVHSHIERSVFFDRETALGTIELQTRQAQIEERSVDDSFVVREDPGSIGEIPLFDRDSLPERREVLLRDFQNFRVLIQSEKNAIGR